MSRDLGRDVPDLEKLYARNLWADFSYPSFGEYNMKQVCLQWYTACVLQVRCIQEGFKVLFCRTTKTPFRHLFGAIWFRCWGSIQL